MQVCKGRKVPVDNGISKTPGELNNLPAGEVCIAPLEGSANGTIVFDLSSLSRRIEKPFKVVVKDGFMVSCESRELWDILNKAENGTNLAELGIGTNPKAKVTGRILEDEKVKVGESTMAFYRATNPTDRPITGTASFNVAPFDMGGYFSKIDCFCFTEQTLQPGESIDMPVTFFIDPEMLEDPETRGLTTVTLSYTFYELEQTAARAAR